MVIFSFFSDVLVVEFGQSDGWSKEGKATTKSEGTKGARTGTRIKKGQLIKC